MVSLSELYSSLDTLKSLGLDVQELQKKIERKEDDVLLKDVIPSLKEITNILLQSFRKDVRIVIEHKVGEDSKITISKNVTSADEILYPELKSAGKRFAQHLFYVKTKSGVIGFGFYNPNEKTFTLLSGSKINAATSKSFNRKDAYQDITSKYCELNDGFYELRKNYTFASPSTASSVVLGRSSNGWTDWKDENGNSLNSIYQR